MSAENGEAEAALVEGLEKALLELRDRSCPTMVALWLDASRRPRKKLGTQATQSLGFTPSPHFMELGKSQRSKYRSLSLWRHAVLWRDVLGAMPQSPSRSALEVIYFTQYPPDERPYSWSKAAANAPGANNVAGPRQLKHLASQGAGQSLKLLWDEKTALAGSATTPAANVEVELLGLSTRDSLDDVLKLTDREDYKNPRRGGR